MDAMSQSRTDGDEQAHDVLAAEAFAVPASDPSLHHPVQLPDDPYGSSEPHDVLAAEEFAVPAAPRHPPGALVPRDRPPAVRLALVTAGAMFALALLRRRRRRRR